MLLNYKQPGNYAPNIIKEDPSVALSFQEPTEPSYAVQADGNIPKGFTGLLMGRLVFVNGICYARTSYDVKIAETRGCRNITTTEMQEDLNKRNLKRILVIRNAAFGDCLMLTPALKALRMKYPEATIDVFGRKDSRVVYENLPFIDNILLLRDTELGSVISDYDEVYDLIHSIECKPEADYMNALDVAAELLGVQIEDTRPVYISSQKEIQLTKQLLFELGIVAGRDSFVTIQAEATAKVRTLPYLTSLTVANQLASDGHKVVFVGGDMNLPLARIYIHQTEGGSVTRIAEVPRPGTKIIRRSLKEGGPLLDFHLTENHPNIVFAHTLYSKYSARVHFGIAHFTKLAIVVDSFWSHLVAALDKPSVSIYSNYHPYTRTKYYDNTTVVTPDYSKVSCGPCNGLFDYCPMFPRQIAPCIGTITPRQILDSVKLKLKNLTPVFQPIRDTPPAVLEEIRPCPFCKATMSRPVTCKGEYIYVQCKYCESIFTAKYPGDKFWSNLKKTIKHNPHYRQTRNTDPRFYIDVISQGMKGCQRPLPKIPVTDLVSTNDKFHKRKAWKDYCEGQILQTKETEDSPIGTELTIWVDGLMESKDPLQSISGIIDRMKPESYLAIIVPLSDRYDRINTWKPLNACVAGLHTAIPSQQSFKIFFDKEEGLYKKDCQLVFISMNDSSSIVVLQRPKESVGEVSWKPISNK